MDIRKRLDSFRKVVNHTENGLVSSTVSYSHNSATHEWIKMDSTFYLYQHGKVYETGFFDLSQESIFTLTKIKNFYDEEGLKITDTVYNGSTEYSYFQEGNLMIPRTESIYKNLYFYDLKYSKEEIWYGEPMNSETMFQNK